MKKLLSLILAITMIMAFIPTAFATDSDATTVTYTYNFYNNSWIERGNTSTKERVLKNQINTFESESLTDTEWAYLGTSASAMIGKASSNLYNMVHGGTYSGTRVVANNVEEWLAFKIEVPTSGEYDVEVKAAYHTSATSDMDVYILPTDAQVTVGDYTGDLEPAFGKSSVYGQYVGNTGDTTCTRENAKKFNEFLFKDISADNYKAIDSASLKYTKNTTPQVISGTSSKNVTLDAGVHIVLLVTNEPGEMYISTLTLTAEIEDEPTNAPTELTGNIAFATGADIQYKIGEESYTNLNANNIASIPVGSSVTVKADDTENFAGWIRGTADSGVWVSSDAEYTFNIMSPTYLTPVYTTPKESATHAVEFWDENGAYVDTITATDGKAVLPTSGYGVVGGSLNGWWIDEETQLLEGDDVSEGITRAVAQYNYGGFGKAIFNGDDSAKYWKRGDVKVAYGEEYTFYQWNGDENITFGTEEIEKNPLVVLDETPVDGAYMIEYDRGDASEIVEAGIIFGSDTDINIGSTDGSKAASQRNGVDENVDDGHGQFCAKPNTESNYDYARGYLIYKGTDNKLYVIYTTAVATSVQ
ncbi:MAG: hypothetical protein IJF32_14265 [Oscillospiraceae bacterium]|nr:hypothetical protein [Oscillospiraceae bacterium]